MTTAAVHPKRDQNPIVPKWNIGWKSATALAATTLVAGVYFSGHSAEEMCPVDGAGESLALSPLPQDMIRSYLQGAWETSVYPLVQTAAVGWIYDGIPNMIGQVKRFVEAVPLKEFASSLQSEISYRFAKHRIEMSYFMIEDIPEEMLVAHPELVKLAIQQNIMALYHIPQKILKACFEAHPELAEWAIQLVIQQGRPWDLDHIPQKILKAYLEAHPELAELAIQQNMMALQFMPQKIIEAYLEAHPELVEVAIQKDWRDALRFIPQEMLTAHPEWIKLAIQQAIQQEGPWVLEEYIPKKMLEAHPELAEWAIQQNVMALQFIPQEILEAHPEWVKLAIQQDWRAALTYIPQEMLTAHPEWVKLAIQKDWRAIQFIPIERMEDYPTLPAVVNENPLGSVIINWHYLRLMSLEVIQANPAVASHAVLQNGRALEFVPPSLRTVELCQTALYRARSGRKQANEFVPEDLREELSKGITEDQFPWNENPVTNPLPENIQKFLNNHSLEEIKTLYDLAQKGFKVLASGSVKHVLIHPDLPGYVIKVPRDDFFDREHENSAIRGEAVTLLHVQSMISQYELHQIIVPKTYLIQVRDIQILIQEEISLNRMQDTSYRQPLAALIRAVDERFYPEISDREKRWEKKQIVQRIKELISKGGPYTHWERQLLERAWVWDLAPEHAHNAGQVRCPNGEGECLAITDFAL